MDSNLNSEETKIREIEDIIDLQKANGNINKVAFDLPLKTNSSISANLAKSLETGLYKVKCERARGKNKKLRPKRPKCFLPDIVSWPSDSDVTVLRMKLSVTNDIKKKVGSFVPGDGLHQHYSSSMINLATLIMKPQPPSKHSLEEYLLPLTSWENPVDPEHKEVLECKEVVDMNYPNECKVFDAMCSHHGTEQSSFDKSDSSDAISTKSKVARFLRLYFCPCCTCLYKMEQLREEPSAYFTAK